MILKDCEQQVSTREKTYIYYYYKVILYYHKNFVCIVILFYKYSHLTITNTVHLLKKKSIIL